MVDTIKPDKPKFEIPAPQAETSIAPRDYKTRICVTGPRTWSDKLTFHNAICTYVKRFSDPVLFVSAAQSSGPSKMIIDWCNKYKYPCLQVKEDWDKHGRAASFMRNTAIADTISNLLVFKDKTRKEEGTIRVTFSKVRPASHATTIDLSKERLHVFIDDDVISDDLVDKATERELPCKIVMVDPLKEKETK